MDRQEARRTIKLLIQTGTPVHPDRARQLYTDAGYEMPEHLKPLELTAEEIAEAEALMYDIPSAFQREE